MKHTIWLDGNQASRRLLSACIVAVVLLTLPMSLQSKDKKNSKSVGFILSQDATPQEVGLPAYPGAQRSADTSDDSSALQMGAWGGNSGFKLVLLKLDSNDAPEKIAAYYRKALAKYGAVLDCRESASKHGASQKNEITCDDDTATDGDFVFKAGTQQEQHVVGIERKGDHTRISLVYVMTPEQSSTAN